MEEYLLASHDHDARFAGRQNGGADFRFFNGGDDLFIRAVRVKQVGF
jgi:hypothetical protein